MRNNLFSIIKKDVNAENDLQPSNQQNGASRTVSDPADNRNDIKFFDNKNSSKNHTNTSTNTMNLIAKGADIEGTLMIDGDLKVEGKIIGDIVAKGNIMLEDGGMIEGNVKANSLIIGGNFKGNAEISGECLVSSTGSVEGDLVINILNVNAGAQVSGNISMYEPQAAESAPIKLNNKTKVVASN